MKDGKILTDKEIHNIIKYFNKLKISGKPKEKFKQVIYKGIYLPYLISSYGRLLSINYRGIKNNPNFMATKIQNNGYVATSISYNNETATVSIHRLVACAFVENPLNKPEVNHKNCIKTDNHFWNLEWVTRKENDEHAWKHELKHARHGEDIGNNKFTEDDVIKVCELLRDNKYRFREISEMTGVSYDMIRNIHNGKSWSHITEKYDFSSLPAGIHKEMIDKKEQQIRKVCLLLESNQYTLKEISDLTGVGYGMVYKVLTNESYTDISKSYNISNYTSRSKNIKRK